MLINKNCWQYKGLVSWFPLIDNNVYIKDYISNNIYRYSTDLSFEKTILPIGFSDKSFSYIASSFNAVKLKNFHITPYNGYTFTYWFKYPVSKHGAISIIDTNSSSSYDINIVYEGFSERCVVYINGTPTYLSFGYNEEHTSRQTDFNDNNWHLLCIVVDVNDVHLYMDGIKYFKYNHNLGVGNIYSNNTELFGPLTNGGEQYFDFRIYDYTWNDAQVLKYYSSLSERRLLYNRPRVLIPSNTIFSNSNYTSLHTINTESLNSNQNIYISGSAVQINSFANLFSQGYANTNSNFDLYISGSEVPINNSQNLYIGGLETNFNDIDLYIYGNESINHSNMLYIGGYSTFDNSINIYTKSFLNHSGSLTFHQNAIHVDNAAATFYTKGQSTFYNDSIDLTSIGSTSGTSGLYAASTLFLNNTQTFDPRNSITLFTPNPTDYKINNISLYTCNQENILSQNTNLFIEGPDGLLSSGINLFINTPPGTTGYIPNFSSIPLYINRENNSYASSVHMYIKSPELNVNSVNMTISGVYNTIDSVDLFTSGSGVYTNYTDTNKLFIRGGN